jgi:hypothetical protein
VSLVEDGAIVSGLDVESFRSRLKEAMGQAEAPASARETAQGPVKEAAVEETAAVRPAK